MLVKLTPEREAVKPKDWETAPDKNCKAIHCSQTEA
jgi:hypothetical protein